MGRMTFRSVTVGIVFAMTLVSDVPAAGAVIYSNDFETHTSGFNITRTAILPSDGSGSTSTWLGDRQFANSSTTLTLTGLTPGVVHHVAFDLYLGGTWDGSISFGPDFFRLNSSSAGDLINATFRNGGIGDSTPVQTYSDATPLGDGGLFPTRAGADVPNSEPIYSFGRGAGNPLLSFTATGETELLTFNSRDFQGIGDEFFALDNVLVTNNVESMVPEPTSFTLLLGLATTLAGTRRRKVARSSR